MTSLALNERETPFGKYRLQEVLGQGATARVFRAVRSGPMGFKKAVALKLIHPHAARDEAFVQGLANEARLGGFLRHRNVLGVDEFDEVDGIYYIAMELVEGSTLRDVIRLIPMQGHIPPWVVLDVAGQIAAGLAAAHEAVDDLGQPLLLVHRDLKPANVMVGNDGIVRVMDFGIAKARSNLFHTTAAGLTKGTPVYMSPEQVQGKPLDRRSDLFSFASVLTTMVTGIAGFEHQHIHLVLRAVLEADVKPSLGRVSARIPELVPILERAFRKKPADRYPSARAMGAELRTVQDAYPAEGTLAVWLAEWMLERPTVDPDAPLAEQVADVRARPAEEGSRQHAVAALQEMPDSIPSGQIPPIPSDTGHGAHRPSPLVGITPRLIRVETGTFTCGSAEDELGRYDDEQPHEVSITRPFLIAATPVTAAQYEDLIGHDPAQGMEPLAPVEMVSWREAAEFCNRLSEAEGRTPAYRIHGRLVTWDRDNDGYRLPTEAEWEYAARAGERFAYAGSDVADEVGWHARNAGGRTHPVGQKRPNAWGLHDFTGNVWEWVWDLYSAYPEQPQSDPVGPATGALRVARGGSWNDTRRDSRVACRRCRASEFDRMPFVGFRLVCNDDG